MASPPTRAAKRGPGAVRYVFSMAILRRNLVIAVMVGCFLSGVNQFEALRAPLTPRLLLKVLVNFLVPFVVSSTSAAVHRPRATTVHAKEVAAD